jgi:tRNA(Ile2)-agmatinylcytidine synthase
VLITPHGPDPVFYGVRGEKVDSLLSATKILETNEKLAGHMIFKSNQGTDDHLKNTFTKTTMKPYSSGIITGIVSSNPKIEKGGHVFFSINYGDDELRCAVYKPTGLSSIALALITGDTIRVGGGIRKASKTHPRILNLEFIEVMNLRKNTVRSNPLCAKCNKKMKSKGRNQGFQCIKCGKVSKIKIILDIPRKVKKQLYIPDISAHRHLSRPKTRLGRVNRESKFDESFSWFSVY